MSDTGVCDFALLPAHGLSTVECHICLAITLINILRDAPDISFKVKFCLVFKMKFWFPCIYDFFFSNFPTFSSGVEFYLEEC